jgi:hypothetical protein
MRSRRCWAARAAATRSRALARLSAVRPVPDWALPDVRVPPDAALADDDLPDCDLADWDRPDCDRPDWDLGLADDRFFELTAHSCYPGCQRIRGRRRLVTG